MLLLKKKDRSMMLYVDYMKLNKVTIKNKYPLPRIDDLMDHLVGACVFSKIDLRPGYQQIQVKSKDILKTTFRTRYNHFDYSVMSFGVSNALGVFDKWFLHNLLLLILLDCFIVLFLFA